MKLVEELWKAQNRVPVVCGVVVEFLMTLKLKLEITGRRRTSVKSKSENRQTFLMGFIKKYENSIN